MDAHRVRAVVEDDIGMRNPFAEIGLGGAVRCRRESGLEKCYLEGVYAKVDERIELVGVPLPCRWIGDVDDSKARLPEVPSGEVSVSHYPG